MAVLKFSKENDRDNFIFMSKVRESEAQDCISEFNVEVIDFEAVWQYAYNWQYRNESS